MYERHFTKYFIAMAITALVVGVMIGYLLGLAQFNATVCSVFTNTA